MGLGFKDVTEIAYGGLVTGMSAWDANRGVTGKEVHKSAAFWAYLVPGVASLVMNAANKMTRYEDYTERITHSFLYGLPGFSLSLINAMKGSTNGAGNVIGQAEQILRSKKLASGQTTKPEFENQRTY